MLLVSVFDDDASLRPEILGTYLQFLNCGCVVDISFNFIFFTAINVAPICFGFVCYFTAPTIRKGEKEREIVKDRLRSNELKNFSQTPLTPTSTVSNHRLRGSHGSQPSCLTLPARTSRLTKFFLVFLHVIDWSLRAIFQPLPASQNSVPQSSRSLRMPRTLQSTESIWIQDLC